MTTQAGRYLGYRPDQWADTWHHQLTNRAAATTTLTGRALLDVLDLHTPTNPYPERDLWADRDCGGDDYNGYDGETPDWPCRTIAAIAGALHTPMYRPCPRCSTHDRTVRVWPDDTLIDHLIYPPRPAYDPARITFLRGRPQLPAPSEPYMCPGSGTLATTESEASADTRARPALPAPGPTP
jgi:hypothetical protein